MSTRGGLEAALRSRIDNSGHRLENGHTIRIVDGEATPFELEFEVKPASRHPWAWLLARVFAVDVMTRSSESATAHIAQHPMTAPAH